MEYVAKSAAVFVDKAGGWEIYQELTGPVLPFPTVSDSWSKDDTTLFISIASFRDKLCPHTLFNAYTKASHPKRLSIGVVQQNTETDVDCLIEYCKLMKDAGKYSPENGQSCPHETSIKMMRVDSRTAKGPTWGRAKAHQLLGDEEFCMQTDAHMDFVPGWDVKIMKMWADTKNEYAVLSTYVADSSQLAHNELEDSKGLGGFHEVPHLCMVTLDGANGLVRVWGTKCMRNLPHPKLTNAIWGAGLSFSKCHAERKVPYDIHTPFIFDGEEFSRAVRFWTWGYDIYTPHRVYVVHNYKKSQSDPNHFDWYASKPDPSEGTLDQSVFRLKTLLAIPGGATDPEAIRTLHQSKYGLGDRRTLDQAIEFSGVDTKNHKILGNRCGKLAFVPFKEHPFGPDFVPPYDPKTEEFTGSRDPGSIYYNSSSKMDFKRWEDAVDAMERLQQQQEMRNLQLDTKSDEGEVSSKGLSRVAHIVHMSFGDGHGLHSQHEPDGSLVMVFLIAFLGIAFNVFCRRRCHMGKGTNEGDINGSFVKTV